MTARLPKVGETRAVSLSGGAETVFYGGETSWYVRDDAGRVIGYLVAPTPGWRGWCLRLKARVMNRLRRRTRRELADLRHARERVGR